MPLVLNQVQYSLLSVERESGVAEVCQELGVRLVAYSPLCLGLLSGSYSSTKRPENLLRSFLFTSLLADKETEKLLEVLKEIGRGRNKTMAQAPHASHVSSYKYNYIYG